MIYLKALLPNPEGADAESEYITVANDGTETISLSGWSIKDRSGRSSILEGVIVPGGEISLPRALTKISLNNDGDTISLFDPAGVQRDELVYDWSVAEGELIERNVASRAVPESAELATQNDVYYDTTPDSLWMTVGTAGFLLAALGVWVMRHYNRNEVSSPK